MAIVNVVMCCAVCHVSCCVLSVGKDHWQMLFVEAVADGQALIESCGAKVPGSR